MGSCASADVKTSSTVRKIETGVVLDSYAAETYLENYGFLQADRYVFTISFTNSPTWAEDNSSKMLVKLPLSDEVVDVRKYVAHKVAMLNWLNNQSRVAHHFVIAMEDRQVLPITITQTRSSGRQVDRKLEIQVVIKGDAEFNRTKTLWPEFVAPVRDLIGFAEPDWNKNGNALRLVDGYDKRFSGIPELEGEDSPSLEEFAHEHLQAQINKYYEKWSLSMAYNVLEKNVADHLANKAA
eukprot:NODE_1110_length_1066_cov_710.593904_g497_i1.p1 GENE.NODE_1110_length_1066_cov_710.593904_g497_i1~~NODE_1110_length_1066_cov_710.593904_g497_i1.p1  ORF type:complete len:239 (-),score=40.00 NODE_1110_length_1066_cov_710.593904_g497_i1:270-986(-)